MTQRCIRTGPIIFLVGQKELVQLEAGAEGRSMLLNPVVDGSERSLVLCL